MNDLQVNVNDLTLLNLLAAIASESVSNTTLIIHIPA